MPKFNDYGVPMCSFCHKGMVVVSPAAPSKEKVDAFREKMFESADRIWAAWNKMGVPWGDPRKPEWSLENQVRAEAKYLGLPFDIEKFRAGMRKGNGVA